MWSTCCGKYGTYDPDVDGQHVLILGFITYFEEYYLKQ